MIGKVLGHRQARTTEGNAHLAADPVRALADRTAAQIVATMRRSSEPGRMNTASPRGPPLHTPRACKGHHHPHRSEIRTRHLAMCESTSLRFARFDTVVRVRPLDFRCRARGKRGVTVPDVPGAF